MPDDGKGRDWSDGAAGQGTKIICKPLEAGKRQGRVSPPGYRGPVDTLVSRDWS